MPVGSSLFDFLKLSWDSAGLKDSITGGYYNGQPQTGSKVQRPYMMVEITSEQPTLFTNKGSQHDLITFTCTVVADTFDQAETLIQLVEDNTKNLQGMIGTCRELKSIRPGSVTYTEVLNYWEITQEFSARTGR